MREILFRGKRIDNGEWAESVCPLGVLHSGHLCEDFAPETIGQYTGLTDKNGKKIFEGDIVKGLHLFGLPVLGVASFKDGAFGLAWQRGDVDEFSAFTSMCNVEYEIIGNIHDNPELLGGNSP